MPNENESNEKQSYETSALKNIINAGAKGAASPSAAAQIAASASRHTPPGAESAVAQALQAGAEMAVAGSKEFMAGTIRQHGRSPSAVLQDLKIQESLAGKTPETPANQSSANKGIESYRSKASGQSADSSKSGGGQSNDSGQER